jgi:hypothetical protein
VKLERPPLRSRQAGTDLVERVGQEISERCEREPGFDSRWTRDEHAVAAGGCRVDSRPPERRLADSGLAFEQEGSRSRPAKKGANRRELLTTADDLVRHGPPALDCGRKGPLFRLRPSGGGSSSVS